MCDIDAVWEAETANEWERLNAPDPYEKVLQEASVELAKCCEGTTKAIYNLMDAQGCLENTPMADAIGTLIEELEEVENSIRELSEKYGKGVRE